ncbi:MAG: putative DNA binding domain-containing protein [Gemmatimonadaceae bacterium]|nr:putative DNA binding domain-containing protein [Gemmatimonadaceae bacterium]
MVSWIAGGESLTVEFKGERDRLNDSDLVETVACLANGRGGVLLVGVEDDGRVTGAQPRHGTYTDARRLEALIGNWTVPSCPVECAVVSIGDKDVLVVVVPSGRPITATTGGVYKRRILDLHAKPQCVPFYPNEMQSREASRGALDYSALIVPEARWSDIDALEVERLRQTIAKNAGRADGALLKLADVDLIKALGLGEGDDRVERIRVAGLLMLGTEEALRRLLPTHEVAFQVLNGTRVQVNDIVRWPLIRVSDELISRFDARNQEQEVLIGAVRVGIPDYSRSGFREAVHNALVHRDYAARGAIHVIWREAELEVSSPGGFPDAVRLENLLVTTPQPRNPVLADAFKRIGLVERTGRGIDTIFEGQLRFGRPSPDYTRSSDAVVQVVLAGGPANLALARFIIERDRPERPVTLETMMLVNAIDRERRLRVADAGRLVQKSEASTRALLERLVEDGVFEARSEGSHRVYRLSAATYRAIGQSAAHTRGSEFEPLQHEQMVLGYLRAHARITRAQVVELCLITPDRAKRLLQRLLNRGEISAHGVGRGTFYQLPSGFTGALAKTESARKEAPANTDRGT